MDLLAELKRLQSQVNKLVEFVEIEKGVVIKPKLEEKQYPIETYESYNIIVDLFPEHLRPKTNKQIEGWFECLDKLERIDNIPFETIVDIVKWGRNDSFWSKNFLSLLKLRTKNKEGIMYMVVFNEQMKRSNPITKTEKYAEKYRGVDWDKIKPII